MKQYVFRAVLLAVFATGATNSAQADFTISKKATHDVSCSAGVCTATAKGANLNVTDLTDMLAAGDTTVRTGGGALAIQVVDGFSWTSTGRLTLDANTSVGFHKPVTVAGQGAVTITYNDGGTGGDLKFFDSGKIDFWNTSGSLIINENSYFLVGSVKAFAAAVHADRFGHYALAHNYNAGADGTFSSSPIAGFDGLFDGLGNKISNLVLDVTVGVSRRSRSIGFFRELGTDGTVRDVHLVATKINLVGGGRTTGLCGFLVGLNRGSVKYSSSAAGHIVGTGINFVLGGLVGLNRGEIANAHAATHMNVHDAQDTYIGGLVGINFGTISLSSSEGSIHANSDGGVGYLTIGGLVGYNNRHIANTFSTTQIFDGHKNCCTMYIGGFAGGNDSDGDKVGGRILTSYAAGQFQKRNKICCSGGFVGYDGVGARHPKFRFTYWDLGQGIKNPHRGAGNILDVHGITGLTDVQLKTALPDGFDPKIWGQSPAINNGYPYLLANPPSQ